MIIDGKLISQQVKDEVKSEIQKTGISAGLTVIIVGDNPASRLYVNNKKKACEYVGIESHECALTADVSENELLSLINDLNKDDKVDGILVQLPLPKHIDEKKIISAIDPDKDVDVFHPYNVGLNTTGDWSLAPCTPAGVMELIKSTGIDISGKNCTVVGRSNIVGKPVASWLTAQNGIVKITHSRTTDIVADCKSADILVVAVGRENFVTADMVKPGAVVIDVGINKNSLGKTVGDVDFEAVKQVAGHITPVPGGVGPMTISMLMRNTLFLAKKHKGII
ncbi:MAG: bifunctional methylenetetrahydrofolate dehydrogenase/methenyltetrahydrofolate cyclohydrolase FolD [Ruminococcus sp.]|jgi:methylenetetrahydrofolate dehydrogenase (NADP+)/methenyltetrahydrofolate cyclohydrolase|nr:bifunctional methylenetetrahydrofolate dehydrogenase/methenyltetrahydrofolate cyclohydrolase FolD [Ruminococcus sp.]